MSILITNGITLIQDPQLLKPKLCTDLIKYIDSSEIQPVRDQNVQCSQILLSHTNKLHAKVLDLFSELRNIIRSYLTLEVMGDSGYQLRKIYGTTRLHTDGSLDELGGTRNLSCIVALNDDFGGGEVNFPKQDFLYQMSKGDILLFPPYWTHPHQVFQPHVGTMRYTINSWFYEKEVSLPNFFFPSGDPTINRYD